MKRILSIFIAIVVFCTALPTVNAVSVAAQKAVLYCPDNKKVIFGKDENSTAKIASTTKIMTVLLTLEYAKKHNKKVKFTEEMIAEGSSMYLKIGEVVTLRDLAIGLMLCSGNDAANAAALAISGSFENFAVRMNRRAKQIGMKNTNFVTPSGLDSENHYSTAYDMALLMAVALENEEFREISSMKSATVNFISPKDKSVTYSNHNRLLSMYEYCVSGKTGYTMAAGRCLVTASQKDGLTLICVTLNDRQDWQDHINLYNYGYDNYAMLNLDDSDTYFEIDTVGGNKDTTTLCVKGDTKLVVTMENYYKLKEIILLDSFIYAPIKENDSIGKIIYTINGKTVAVHKIVAAEYNNSE